MNERSPKEESECLKFFERREKKFTPWDKTSVEEEKGAQDKQDGGERIGQGSRIDRELTSVGVDTRRRMWIDSWNCRYGTP